MSPPAWALGLMSAITILTQLITLYDPSGFMSDFQVESEPGVRMIGEFPAYETALVD